MIDLVRAEWTKALGNRLVAGFTIWVYPAAAFAFVLVMTVLALVGAKVGGFAGRWTDGMVGIFGVVSRFPGNVFGRLPLLGFMAVAFAGEYEWGTWKNVLTRNRRQAILVSKLLSLAILALVSLVLTSVIWGIGVALPARIAGIEYGPPLSGAVLAEFTGKYLRESALALLAALLLGGYTVLATMLTRSNVGALLISFGFSIVESLSLALFLLLGRILERPGIVDLYALTPGYSLDNIRAWLVGRAAVSVVVPEFTSDFSLAVSFAVLTAWIVGMIAFASWLFRRQDITV